MGQHLWVAVADDEPKLRELMAQWSSQSGHSVTTVAASLEPVKAIEGTGTK